MEPSGIIFDCDGTLMNSLGQALESFNEALVRLGEKPRPKEAWKRYFGAAADRIFLHMLEDEEKARAAFEHFLDHQRELALSTPMHSGIRELLAELCESKIPLGIVTGRHARDLEILLTPHGLVKCFGVMIADNHVRRSKPAPDGILLACERLGLSPSRTLYVGDTVTDLQAAHAAGSVPVAALWDERARPDEMLKECPAFMAKEPREVWQFFKSRWRTA